MAWADEALAGADETPVRADISLAWADEALARADVVPAREDVALARGALATAVLVAASAGRKKGSP